MKHPSTHNTTLSSQPLPLPDSSVHCFSNTFNCNSPLPHPSPFGCTSLPTAKITKEDEEEAAFYLSLQRADVSAATACDILFFRRRFEKKGQTARETKKREGEMKCILT